MGRKIKKSISDLIVCMVLIAEIILFAGSKIYSQPSSGDLKNWHLLSERNNVPGTGVNQAYQTVLKGKTAIEIIVAVIDGGVDTKHDDLKQNIWINPREIADNGIDDDKNGYIDDIHGWNFIGSKKGENVHYDTYESTRTLARLKEKYKNIDPAKIAKNDLADYNKFLALDKELETKRKDAENQWQDLRQNETVLLQIVEAVSKELGNTELTIDNLKKLDTTKSMFVNVGQKLLISVLETEPGVNSIAQVNQSIKQQFSLPRAEFEAKFLYQLNPDFDSRLIIGDKENDPRERFYGNNDVKGPDAFHGTHVAGIIGAVRDNQIGMDGIATKAKIMALRVVPDGDERDKDVANAIRYAVDQGAKVINMSFGKGESPDKKVIDEAIRYAEKKDVILVHAAGNAGEDNDQTTHYPVNTLSKKGLFVKKKVNNWLDIGALSFTLDEDMIASFSNYGQKSVDIFSPGVRIYSTAPDNKYEYADGTSMASPVAAGVAALIRSYYPALNAKQVIKAIKSGGISSSKKLVKPGSSEKVLLSELCNSGHMLNAVNALEYASKMKGQNKTVKSGDKPRA